ncbi:MAG: hypothetical protein FWC32_08730 [Firmicutes bacterium]|nr:hypothetical protein [Bacillota bacterium]
MISSKYNMLYPPLVQRIYAEESRKGSKNREKAVKTRLHQMFGAYVQGNAHKKAAALLQELEAGKGINEICAAIMALHASTKERLPYMEDFCRFVTTHTGPVETIIDLGCGFNPFSVTYWGMENLKAYYAYDIDTRTKDLLNRFFAYLCLPPAADCADLAVETPAVKSDLSLMCKLVPVLEAQAPGRGFELARLQNASFLVITYPLKSLGGREKGMGKNYAAQFEKAYAEGALGGFSLAESREVGNELVYVLTKKVQYV